MRGRNYLLAIFILSISGGLIAFIYGQYEKFYILKLPVKFIYDKNPKHKSPLLYIKKLKYRKPYLNYIAMDRLDYDSIPINFPLISLPWYQKIYVQKYLNDSLVQFYDPDHHDRLFSFTTGFVHRDYVHDTLPEKNNDSDY